MIISTTQEVIALDYELGEYCVGTYYGPFTVREYGKTDPTTGEFIVYGICYDADDPTD